MWLFKKKPEEYKRGEGDKPLNGNRYLIINGMSINTVEAEYKSNTNEYYIIDSGLTVRQEDWKIIREVIKQSSSEKTLTMMGYRDCGGELWKPPIGKAPDYLKEKENEMKNNKHPHHDLIVEWAKDTSKHIQIDVSAQSSIKWASAGINEVLSDFSGDESFRFKPREFVKGHWYPCLGVNGVSVNMWDGEGFTLQSLEQGSCYPAYFHSIGKSLGEIDFGSGE